MLMLRLQSLYVVTEECTQRKSVFIRRLHKEETCPGCLHMAMCAAHILVVVDHFPQSLCILGEIYFGHNLNFHAGRDA